jgi:hypothetical protein
MTTWVLIWIVFTANGLTTSSQEFFTEESCAAAALSLTEETPRGEVFARCYPKPAGPLL